MCCCDGAGRSGAIELVSSFRQCRGFMAPRWLELLWWCIVYGRGVCFARSWGLFSVV